MRRRLKKLFVKNPAIAGMADADLLGAGLLSAATPLVSQCESIIEETIASQALLSAEIERAEQELQRSLGSDFFAGAALSTSALPKRLDGARRRLDEAREALLRVQERLRRVDLQRNALAKQQSRQQRDGIRADVPVARGQGGSNGGAVGHRLGALNLQERLDAACNQLRDDSDEEGVG